MESKNCMIARMEKSFPNAESDTIQRHQLLERILNFIIAGYETTATTTSWIFYLLAKHPKYVERIYNDVSKIKLYDSNCYKVLETIDSLNTVIKESMRLFPALWFNIRYIANNYNIGNIKFRCGDKIMLLPFISNYDFNVYPEPKKFKPERFENDTNLTIFPFGYGPRLCAGKALAEMELKLIVSKFVQEFTFKVVNNPIPVGGVILQPNEDILIKFLKRNKVEKNEK